MFALTYRNATSAEVTVTVEPWSEVFRLAPGEDLSVSSRASGASPAGSNIEIVSDGPGAIRLVVATHRIELSGSGFERKYELFDD